MMDSVFQGKEAVLAAAAARRYAGFEPPLGGRDARARLVALGLAYAVFLRGSLGLLRYLVASADAVAAPSARFAALVDRALEGVALTRGARRTAVNAVADLVHGFALAGEAAPLRLLRAELGLLGDGITRPRTRARRARPPRAASGGRGRRGAPRARPGSS